MRWMLAAAVVASSVTAVLTSPVPVVAASAALPDLGMARLTDLTITTSAGRQQLRFSSTVVNVGASPFQVVASRSDGSAAFAVAQRIYDGKGGWSDTPVPASLVYAGDGHAHWHVRDLESYTLQRLDDGALVGTGAKGGYCFMDTTAYRLSLPGAPRSAQYGVDGCGDQAATQLSMGLSVGWGDKYSWTLSDQYVDVTGIPAGKYRLLATADAVGYFTEANRGNNATWVDFSVSARRGGLLVKILGYGPSA